MSTCNIVLLSVSSCDSCTSICISTENENVLFDVGEGCQRINHESTGGLPGLLLTACDAGRKNIHIFGPSPIQDYWKAASPFCIRDSLDVTVHEVNDESTYLNESIRITAVTITSKLSNLPSHTSYICDTIQLPGKFNVKKAIDLGIPKGPLYAKLKSGESIQLVSGTMITPDQVLEEAEPTRTAVIICDMAECDQDDISTFFMHSAWKRFQYFDSSMNNGPIIAPSKILDCIFHLSSKLILESSAYKTFISSFGPHTQHITCGAGMNSNQSSFLAATFANHRLHQFCPELVTKVSLVHVNNGTTNTTEETVPIVNMAPSMPSIVPGLPLQTFHLLPASKRGLAFPGCSRRVTSADVDDDEMKAITDTALNKKTSIILKLQSHTFTEKTEALQSMGKSRIYFLGTGCAIPSKYRNVSGILLRITPTNVTDDPSIVLLDAGEGSWNQLMRIANNDPSLFVSQLSRHMNQSQTQVSDSVQVAIAMQLKASWISHPHADHHLGLISIIVNRHNLLSTYYCSVDNFTAAESSNSITPMVVIAPPSVLQFLHNYSQLVCPAMANMYIPVSCRQYDPNDPCLTCDDYWTDSASSCLPIVGKPRQTTGDTNESRNDTINLDTLNNMSADTVTMPLMQSEEERYFVEFDVSNTLPNNRENKKFISQNCANLCKRNLNIANEILTGMGIVQLTNCKVNHCYQSYGAALVVDINRCAHIDDSGRQSPPSKRLKPSFENMFKLVYSGDTRPCNRLVEIGRNATILIHEATFDDSMEEEALSKRHSTITEAMGVARRMNAYRTILTHFSQRYPHIPPLDMMSQEMTDQFTPLFAFDYMSIKCSDLQWSFVMTPVMSALFKDPATDVEDELESPTSN